MKQNNASKIFIAMISALVSLAIGGFCLYLSSLKNFWFIPIGIYFIFEGLFIIIPLFVKDGYKAMRIQGIFQIIGVILMMDYLLVMSLWNDPNRTMVYWPTTYIVFGVALLIKLITTLIFHISIKKEYNPLVHAYRNNDLITALYLIIMIELVVMNQFYPGEHLNVFTNLFKEKTIWVYIIDIALNANCTILAALSALSTQIRSKTKEELSVGGKIKHTIEWFNKNEVSMFFGLIFTSYLAFLALINVTKHWFYIVLAAFYLGTAAIRLVNYIWHKSIVKKCGDNKIRENRKSSFILLFNAIAYFLFSIVIAAAAIFLISTKKEVPTNIYLFLFIIVPFAILRFINAIKTTRVSRRENDTYKLGVGYISFISAFFSLVEVAAISTVHAPQVAKYIVVFLNIFVLQIVVLVICVTFLIHFFRSLIINRKSKEKKK